MEQIFNRIEEVRIEMSNVCNLHCRKCPLSIEQKEEHLPIKNIYDVLDSLVVIHYKKEIGFHMYSEPIIDPRLYAVMESAKSVLGEDIPLLIWTNGITLTETLMHDFLDLGNVRIIVSVYNDKTFEKVNDWGDYVTLCDYRTIGKDDRLLIYEQPEHKFLGFCHAPYGQIIITYKGDVSLCCYDWKRTVTFGNIKKIPLEEILQSKKMDDAYRNLGRGRRIFDVCQRCKRYR